MAKRVFFSFHYRDVIDFRANVVRKHWVVKDDREEAGYFDASIWEEAKKTNDLGLTRLINGALENTTATCVLIGSMTCERPWVRYEIIRSVWRGNRVFAVHINGIKGKDQMTKTNGPNPFDYLALKYSQDGATVEVFEAQGGKWVAYDKMPSYKLKAAADQQKRGRQFKLSELGFRLYDWVGDDGYNKFADWVG